MKVENPNIQDVNKPIRCNKCGEYCSLTDKLEDNYGLLNASFSSGYSSIPQFGDMVRFTFSLCEHCLFDLFKTFKNKPVEHKMLFINKIINDEVEVIEVEDNAENTEKQKQFAKHYIE
jgi:hypothetical protein